MKFGAVYPQTELDGDPEAVRRFGLAAEKLGYNHLVAYDHVVGAVHADREPKLWGPYTENDPFHDPFVMFAYLAGMTTELEFMSGVLILPQRQTVLVAKQAADLDLLSGGRFRMGVGTGWNYVEYDALGIDFHVRGKRMDEQVGYLRRLWGEELVSFDGQFDKMDRGCLIPRPKRQIPIYIGGFTEPAFRRGGRMGDGFAFGGTVEQASAGLARVEHHASEAGRSLENFGKELFIAIPGPAAAFRPVFDEWAERGGTHASVVTMGGGLKGVDAHIDYIADAANALGIKGR